MGVREGEDEEDDDEEEESDRGPGIGQIEKVPSLKRVSEEEAISICASDM